jgi:hypothetical protein
VILVATIILLLLVVLVAALVGGDRLAFLASRPGSWGAAPTAVTLVVTPPAQATPLVIVITSQPVQPPATQPPVPADTPLPATTPLPTPTLQPPDTPLPTPTPLPTYTPLPTHTPLPTYTLPPTDTPLPPTPLPAPTQRPEPTATEPPLPELSVTFRDFHYECRLNEVWTRGRPPYGDAYGDRSFQALMVITNQTADKTLEPLWRPDRWIVTDGSTEWEETYAWQYGKREGGVVKTYPQPPIVPGDTQTWTWVCYPMPRGAWVKAAEFTAWGQTYRFEFPKPAPGEFNYVNCP